MLDKSRSDWGEVKKDSQVGHRQGGWVVVTRHCISRCCIHKLLLSVLHVALRSVAYIVAAPVVAG